MTTLDDGSAPALTGRRAWISLVLLCTAQFMLILDISVANVALPTIGADLGLDSGLLTWVITLYVLMFGGFMVLGGRVADLVGAKRTITAGLVVFAGASFAAGLATDALSLLGARGAQGLAAAFISPAALALITTGFSGSDRTRALSVWAAVGATGAVAGVLLGGLIVAGPGWRWTFLVTGPVALALLALLARALPASSRTGARARLDLAGALLVTAATMLFIAALQNLGVSVGALPLTPLLLAAATAAYTAFAVVEKRRADPLFDLTLLRRRGLRPGVVLMLMASALMAGNFVLGSFFLQQHEGWSALATGLAFVPSAVATVLGAHLGGRIVIRVGPRPAAAVGMLATMIGAGAAAAWLTPVAVIVGLTICGLGLGTAFVAATTTALSHAGHEDAGVVSGVVNTFHEFGAAIGVSALSAIAIGPLAAPTTGAGFANAWGTAALVALVAAVIAAFAVPRGTPAGDHARFVH